MNLDIDTDNVPDHIDFKKVLIRVQSDTEGMCKNTEKF